MLINGKCGLMKRRLNARIIKYLGSRFNKNPEEMTIPIEISRSVCMYLRNRVLNWPDSKSTGVFAHSQQRYSQNDGYGMITAEYYKHKNDGAYQAHN